MVVPAHRDGEMLEVCLDALAALDPPPREVIVAVDGGCAAVAAAAERRRFRVISLPVGTGVSVARNAGATAACGEWLMFIDSDVRVNGDHVAAGCAVMERHPYAVAAFGSYDDDPADAGMVSRYRNLLHHFTHQQASRDAVTFWAGCGMVRRDVLLALGGFAGSYRRPSIEDIELGYRMSEAGYRIVLDPGWQVCHLKKWGFGNMVRTDTVERAFAWTQLVLVGRRGFRRDLNTDPRSRLSAAGSALALAGVALLPWWPSGGLAAAVLALVAVWFLNRSFYRLLRRCGGWHLAVAGAWLHIVYFLCALSGFAAAWWTTLWRRTRCRPCCLRLPPSFPLPQIGPQPCGGGDGRQQSHGKESLAPADSTRPEVENGGKSHGDHECRARGPCEEMSEGGCQQGIEEEIIVFPVVEQGKRQQAAETSGGHEREPGAQP